MSGALLRGRNKSGTYPPHGTHPYFGARRAASDTEGLDVDLPRDALIVITGLSGSGSRASPSTPSMPRSAALCREPVGLCTPVPRNDAEAQTSNISTGCRRRRSASNRRRRAATRADGGHRHRNLRLYAPALGACRHSLFARDRRADFGADGQPDGRPGDGPGPKERAYLLAPRGARRRMVARNSRSGRRTSHLRPRRRGANLRDRGRPGGARQEIQGMTSRSWSIGSSYARGSTRRAGGQFRDGAETCRRARLCRPRRWRGSGGATARRRRHERRRHPGQSHHLFREISCLVSGFTIAEIEPRLFSFNAPQGACPACDGLGERLEFDPELVVPNHALRPARRYRAVGEIGTRPRLIICRCSKAWAKPMVSASTRRGRICPARCSSSSFMAAAAPVELTCWTSRRTSMTHKAFEGVIGNLNRRMLQTERPMREELGKISTRSRAMR